LATLRFRDRDAVITKDCLIFRVFGYSHPPSAYVCDVEYAPEEIFKSKNPKAFRSSRQGVFYKFYEDEGLKFIKSNYPQYTILHEPLYERVVGVNHSDITRVAKPEEKLRRLVETEPKDELLTALHDVLKLTEQRSGLATKNFGVFGSMLHGFYHPKFSDIDLIIYGRENVVRLCETLRELYREETPSLRNEFENEESVERKRWRFRNYSAEEYVRHQRRKLIYALFKDEKSGRTIKTEFEPVKDWKEISNEYEPKARIWRKGWVKMLARIIEDHDAPFIPSIYGIEPLDVLYGTKGADEAKRIVSFMEEFRMQAYKDEMVYVEGNLEEVTTPKGSLYQITLTYRPRYYEQVLKVVS